MKLKSLIVLMMLATSMVQSATVQELQSREQELYHILGEYWIDKSGVLHLGNKESADLHFAFSESFMKRLTPEQIKISINTPMSRFTSEQKDEFLQVITPFLNELATIRDQLKMMRTKLDTYAGVLAVSLGKTQQDIMHLPLTNIKNLISILPDDKKATIKNKIDLSEFNNLRDAFDIKIVQITPAKKNTEETFGTPTTVKRSTGSPASFLGVTTSSSGKKTFTDDDDSDND
jgi:hypothetical protein